MQGGPASAGMSAGMDLEETSVAPRHAEQPIPCYASVKGIQDHCNGIQDYKYYHNFSVYGADPDFWVECTVTPGESLTRTYHDTDLEDCVRLRCATRSGSDEMSTIPKAAFKSLAALEDPPRMPCPVSELHRTENVVDPAAVAAAPTRQP